MKKKEEMIRKTLEKSKSNLEILDWDALISKHRERIRKEERDRKEKQENAEKKKASWELLRMCRDYIKENGRSWKTDQRKRDFENNSQNQKMKRLEKVAEKKEKIREKALQKRLLENWLILPEKEKNKYRDDEEKMQRMELKEVKYINCPKIMQ